MTRKNTTTSKVTKRRAKRVIPGTSKLMINSIDWPGSSIISLDVKASNPQTINQDYQINMNSFKEDKAISTTHSMVFTLDNKNHLNNRRQDVPGTSTIKMADRKTAYINEDTQHIKYPEMIGKRLFQMNKDPSSQTQDKSRKSSNNKPHDHTALHRTVPINNFTSTVGSNQDESASDMNVRPFTNHMAGTASKYKLRDSSKTAAPPTPGTYTVFHINQNYIHGNTDGS
ncbi:uncharacterized protein RJT21DRAFT_114972 [Scheffersomyces amazonensis]|uniref:uncharacterized protein n=1 Tax=Scheffersomyces amazonensis TaxID=1078765 RepID=UPI00315DD945